MEYRKLGNSELKISALSLGTWAFGGDKWWGHQDDRDSVSTLLKAVDLGINLIDTAPVYGRGHSEEVVGRALEESELRDKVILATKVGLSWEGRAVYPNLKKQSILEEIEDSLRRLKTDVIDLYQVHWPDPDTPIKKTAEVLCELYKSEKVRAVGVSNYSVPQMKEFMKYCPLHSLQPPYNMFRREIEDEILPFCKENNIGVIVYAPLHSGVLTGKFFFGQKIPSDIIRNINPDLKKENFNINKRIMEELKEIAAKYNKSLSQFCLNWTISGNKGVTSAIVGSRRPSQIEENAGACGWQIDKEDFQAIEAILEKRETAKGDRLI